MMLTRREKINELFNLVGHPDWRYFLGLAKEAILTSNVDIDFIFEKIFGNPRREDKMIDTKDIRESIERACGGDDTLLSRSLLERLLDHIDAQRARIEKLEDILEFYADPQSWVVPYDDSGNGVPAFEDMGNAAREALRGDGK